LVRCEISDQSAFGGVFPKLFDLRQIVLHRRCPASCSKSRSGNKRESIAPRPSDRSDQRSPWQQTAFTGLESSPVSQVAAGCHVPIDRHERMGESAVHPNEAAS
jgi:hypothetical protein